MNRPYGLGLGGHANKCDCTKCAKYKARAFGSRIDSIRKLRLDGLARLPTSSDQTVFVRAHFKRSPHHLSRFPRTLRLFHKTLKGAL